jgi:hypothetical protein
MKRSSLRMMLMTGLMLVTGANAVRGHHSFVAEYDPNKPITLTGAVTKLEWTNPHARFYIDVKDASGAVVNWELELGSPNTLIRYAWKRDTMKIGDVVTVEGYLAKDGSKMANAKTVKFADGKVFNAGSSADLRDTK